MNRKEKILPSISKEWLDHLSNEFQKEYMQKLKSFLSKELDKKKIIYPHGNEIFTALNLTPLNKVKVVILGQDPYHGPNQAHGLCFSVRPQVKIPPSLINIYKEIKNDLGIDMPAHGYLSSWAKQGVLLLNTVLTVESGKAASHQNKGWETFTDQIVKILNDKRENIIFLLWGSHAQKKGASININKHKVLKSPHPSPLSAHRGFLGNKHFSKTNHYLKSIGKKPIDWSIPKE